MRKFGISQLPVMENGKFVGSVDDTQLLDALTKDAQARDKSIENYMQAAFGVVQASDPLNTVAKSMAESGQGAVLVDLGQGKYHIITRHDLVAAMS